jgi:hypothetical protein
LGAMSPLHNRHSFSAPASNQWVVSYLNIVASGNWARLCVSNVPWFRVVFLAD